MPRAQPRTRRAAAPPPPHRARAARPSGGSLPEHDVAHLHGLRLHERHVGDAPDLREVGDAALEHGRPGDVAETTSVFCDAFASVFARRMPMSASLTAGSRPVGVAVANVVRRPRRGVHRARRTSSSTPPRSRTAAPARAVAAARRSRSSSAVTALGVAARRRAPSRARGSRRRTSRRTARSPRARGRGRTPRSASVAVRTTTASSASMSASSGAVTEASKRPASEPRAGSKRVHELRGVQHLDRQAPPDLHLLRVLRVEGGIRAQARLRPPSSAPRRSRARRASPAGVTTLPLDFDIFLRSGSTMKPEMPALRPRHDAVLELGAQHGREQPGADDVLALAAQRVGEHELEQLVVAPQPPAICGVSDEVAQVSMMSSSPSKPPGMPRCDSSKPLGACDDGSTGRSPSSGTSTLARARPARRARYQTGIGTPKNRWRETSQSPVRPPTQFS